MSYELCLRNVYGENMAFHCQIIKLIFSLRKNFMLSIYFHEFFHKLHVVKFWKFPLKYNLSGYRKKRWDHNFRTIPEFVWRDKREYMETSLG